MPEEKRRYKAEIDGKSYLMIGPGSDAHMAAVTSLVNEQLTEIKRLSPGISKEDAAILIAFNAVSDELNLKKQLDAQEDEPTSQA
ncbi:hypothetical protein IV38_GL002108 [Lactobacillus selangorensis]|uniref:Stimulator of FtsZ polymerization and component of cell-division Z-ring n=1 Tax=Lactobacillus selangorensis TaxID=81857 RepID=A0A0R2FG25_9LACO|nr:cell division protein ZapA [Lactobacillus selangorensis]KRN27456.1 hypothetical protein IV38_GL002108 [Lactobacillus selangorensis]KRN31347.1 hypothetical protein IV40_GL001342 [Lactobacillus selangorensis]